MFSTKDWKEPNEIYLWFGAAVPFPVHLYPSCINPFWSERWDSTFTENSNKSRLGVCVVDPPFTLSRKLAC